MLFINTHMTKTGVLFNVRQHSADSGAWRTENTTKGGQTKGPQK